MPPDSEPAPGVRALLAEPRFELLPLEGFEEQLRRLPAGATVAITASPSVGLEATIDRAETAAARGYAVVPHVAARYVRNEAHLEEIAARLADAGVTDVFVPGGDRDEPIGEFDSAHALLATLADLEYGFEEVGITGYPEGHPVIDDGTLAASLARKEPYATYVVTQLCYDHEAVLEWIADLRARGIDLPVEVGIPGVVDSRRLLRLSRKVGVGESIGFLRKTGGIAGFVRRLVGGRGTYAPDELIDGLAPAATDPAYGVRGVHVYTFNRIAALESWRRGRLNRDR
ncbi:methylenetetrahydrofolate reductase [Natronococcus wangiae]|uniref:methylenetetrahydrofolate reductase n=1 Tax=Natronococcus wangiae TaxID=3068275 RepID=UPI00273D0541|nr:methylenetetrahydrofolate reductase [Natronococcus sp. AD5]